MQNKVITLSVSVVPAFEYALTRIVVALVALTSAKPAVATPNKPAFPTQYGTLENIPAATVAVY